MTTNPVQLTIIDFEPPALPEDQAAALGKRLLACTHVFKVRPGMVDLDDAVCLRYDEESGEFWYAYRGDDTDIDDSIFSAQRDWTAPWPFIPDLSDAGTLGHVISLARKIWPSATSRWANNLWRVSVPGAGIEETAEHEAEAWVQLLERAESAAARGGT
jgi:hypothetical protein